MEEKRYGGVNNPFEPIKIINHYNLNFNIGNVIKYILRDKGSKLEDLKKAVDYLQNEIEKLEPKEEEDENIVFFDGVNYEFVEDYDKGCDKCDIGIQICDTGKCRAKFRKDKKEGIFKKRK